MSITETALVLADAKATVEKAATWAKGVSTTFDDMLDLLNELDKRLGALEAVEKRVEKPRAVENAMDTLDSIKADPESWQQDELVETYLNDVSALLVLLGVTPSEIERLGA